MRHNRATTSVRSHAERGVRRHVPLSDINVTPFVDVMLVLLIVFMVTAPMLTVGVPIDLPRADAPQVSVGDGEPVTVSIDANGLIFLQDAEVDLDKIAVKLLQIANGDHNKRVYVRGDKTVDYGLVMRVMGVMSAAGFRRIALITERENEG